MLCMTLFLMLSYYELYIHTEEFLQDNVTKEKNQKNDMKMDLSFFNVYPCTLD